MSAHSLQHMLKSVLNSSHILTQSQDSDQINLLQSRFRELEATSREYFQESVRDVGESIVFKLQSNTPLSEKEKKVLELLITGDAQYYLKVENNYQDWIDEYQRLITELKKFAELDAYNPDQLCRLRATVRDALNLMPSIVYYRQASIRKERFKQVISGNLALEDRMMLASIVKTALESELQ